MRRLAAGESHGRRDIGPEGPPTEAGDPGGASGVPGPDDVARPSPEAHGDGRALCGDHRPAAQVFLRGLGLVYLIAFASLAVQVDALVGRDGLLPVGEFLDAHRDEGVSRLARFPTLFWLWDGDPAVRGGALVGMVLGLALLLGWRSRGCLAALWALFLSYVTVGREFFWFQWDSLLLEASALALLLPASSAVPPHPLVVFLFRWLLFRLLFESGLAKVQGGVQSWGPLLAMVYYYETAPLPSLGGWYAHQLPLWIHRWTAALTLLGELIGPLLIWGGRWARRGAFALIAAFQVFIQATANYGYFNLLAFVLGLFLLDARDLAWLPAWVVGRDRGRSVAPRRPWWRTVAGWGIAGVGGSIFLLTLVELLALVAGPGVARLELVTGLREAVRPFRVANRYHLFAHVDPRRVEAEIEWTTDAQAWRPYEHRYKPGRLDRRPAFVAPHQPRLDFQLWFFTLGRDGGAHAYFNNLVRRLCDRTSTVERLFHRDSLPPGSPLAIRVAYYRYRMTDVSTRDAEGRYWSRQLLDYHPTAYFCDASTPPRF